MANIVFAENFENEMKISVTGRFLFHLLVWQCFALYDSLHSDTGTLTQCRPQPLPCILPHGHLTVAKY